MVNLGLCSFISTEKERPSMRKGKKHLFYFFIVVFLISIVPLNRAIGLCNDYENQGQPYMVSLYYCTTCPDKAEGCAQKRQNFLIYDEDGHLCGQGYYILETRCGTMTVQECFRILGCICT